MSFAKTPIYYSQGIRCKISEYEDEIQNVYFKNESDNQNPEYSHDGDSGFDLRAWITKTDEGAKLNKSNGKYQIVLKSLERKLIHTGLYFNLPRNTELQVRPRSGNALKLGLSVLNTPGTVDSNYTNEVGVIVVNISKKEITIESGDRIAQAVLMPVYVKELVNLQQVDEIDENSSRNKDGFGSTGVK